MSDFKEVKFGQFRQDWNQTSTGVGHHHRPGYYFPDTEFRVRIHPDYHGRSFLFVFVSKSHTLIHLFPSSGNCVFVSSRCVCVCVCACACVVLCCVVVVCVVVVCVRACVCV